MNEKSFCKVCPRDKTLNAEMQTQFLSINGSTALVPTILLLDLLPKMNIRFITLNLNAKFYVFTAVEYFKDQNPEIFLCRMVALTPVSGKVH